MTTTIWTLFISLVLFEVIGLPVILRNWLNIPFTKRVKILECFPCWTFWIGVLITLITLQPLEIHNAFLAYLIAVFYDKLFNHGNI